MDLHQNELQTCGSGDPAHNAGAATESRGPNMVRQNQSSAKINTTDAYRIPMASMGTCACGWTVITPLGPDDVKKHVSIHLRDNHPGTVLTADELDKLIKTV